ncbi:hypothetical protein BDF20DRAFT_846156 [Mycotypha africana]|uniref:uncharacterized protein n=1 Tax=Mycotypha africana TaxID=64632 RepID=UPI002300B34E|nr:uncharacterized protein BDF20DRAFT_846156 [Mycotypha africana]KAI8991738.1 hypothetical protein BDF20DRAFT_846156 [Mycotypha africana]
MTFTSIKYHAFTEKEFQGLVYCDYCGKLLWGSAIQTVQCTECGYNCHSTCSDMVVQCRPLRRYSPDSLSFTDSEVESVSKHSYSNYYGGRSSFDRYNSADETNSLHSATSGSGVVNRKYRTFSTETPPPALHTRTSSYTNNCKSEEPLKSPTISSTTSTGYYNLIGNSNNNYYVNQQQQQPFLGRNDSGSVNGKKPSSASSSTIVVNKAYRITLKQQLQKQQQKSSALRSTMSNNNNNKEEEILSPRATAKLFTRLVARSKVFFFLMHSIRDIYMWKNKQKSTFICIIWICLCLDTRTLYIIPLLIIYSIHSFTGINSNNPSNTNIAQVLLPRFDENTPEYYRNMEHMQHAFLFLIRLYDNLAYHLQHVSLNKATYRILFLSSLFISCLFAYLGRWLILTIGLVIMLNQTCIGRLFELVFIQFLMMGLLQFIFGLMQKIQRKRLLRATVTVDIKNRKTAETNNNSIQRRPMEVSLYENQRWWAGVGYTSQLLRLERSAWSNITGTEPLPTKEDMPPPTNYEWDHNDNGWQLDTTGPWIDEALEIVVSFFFNLWKTFFWRSEILA